MRLGDLRQGLASGQFLSKLVRRDPDCGGGCSTRGTNAASTTEAVATTARAALRLHLVDHLVDALIGLGLLGGGLVCGQSAAGDRRVDTLVRRILQGRRHVSGRLTVSLSDLSQRLAGQLLLQLLWRDADGRRRGVQVSPEAT
jgi:hypothetical protein